MTLLIGCTQAPTVEPVRLTPEAPRTATASVSPEPAKPRPLVLVTEREVRVDGALCADQEIVAIAKQLGDTRVFIEADPKLDWYAVVRVVDLLKQGGIVKLAFIVPWDEVLHFEMPRASELAAPPVSPTPDAPPAFLGPILGVEVARDGSLLVEGRPGTDEQLAERARAVLANNDDVRAVLLGRRGVRYGRIMQLYGLLQRAGLKKTAFGIEP